MLQSHIIDVDRVLVRTTYDLRPGEHTSSMWSSLSDISRAGQTPILAGLLTPFSLGGAEFVAVKAH